SHLGCTFRYRRSHWTMERWHSRFGCALRNFQRCGGSLVPRRRAAVPHSPITTVKPIELFAYAVLGLAGGLAAVIFAKLIAFFRPRLRALPKWTQYFQSAVAGLIIGLIGYLGAPQIMGAGYEYMDQAMHDQFTWQLMAIFAGLKILATTLSFASGTPGGMFAPALFIGAMLGGAVSGMQHHFYPHLAGY